MPSFTSRRQRDGGQVAEAGHIEYEKPVERQLSGLES